MAFTLLMNKKNFILITVVFLLAGVYVVYFTDWFRPKTMQISHTSRPMAGARGSFSAPLTFSLGNYYELTEIKVVPLDDLRKNPLAQPVWHLVSDSGSDDVDRFSYGQNIGGMHPAIAGARAEPLQPGVNYRIFVHAGRTKGQHDFQIDATAGK